MISGEVLKYRKGLRSFMPECWLAAVTGSSQVPLAVPTQEVGSNSGMRMGSKPVVQAGIMGLEVIGEPRFQCFGQPFGGLVWR